MDIRDCNPLSVTGTDCTTEYLHTHRALVWTLLVLQQPSSLPMVFTQKHAGLTLRLYGLSSWESSDPCRSPLLLLTCAYINPMPPCSQSTLSAHWLVWLDIHKCSHPHQPHMMHCGHTILWCLFSLTPVSPFSVMSPLVPDPHTVADKQTHDHSNAGTMDT